MAKTVEELQEELIQQKEANKELQAKYDDVTNKNKELTESNAKLVDYNNKLFMRVGNQLDEHTEDEEVEMTEDEYAAKLAEEIIKGE